MAPERIPADRPAGYWPNEISLIRAARSGARDAIDVLCNRYWHVAYRIALARVRDHGLAEDVAQEALHDAIRNLDRFKVGKPFDRWLATIASRRAIDLLRKRSTQVGSLTLDGDTDQLQGNQPSPELLSTLAQALDEMPTEWREVVYLHRVLGLSIKEAGALLQLPAGTVSSRLSRADSWLQTQLEGPIG